MPEMNARHLAGTRASIVEVMTTGGEVTNLIAERAGGGLCHRYG